LSSVVNNPERLPCRMNKSDATALAPENIAPQRAMDAPLARVTIF